LSMVSQASTQQHEHIPNWPALMAGHLGSEVGSSRCSNGSSSITGIMGDLYSAQHACSSPCGMQNMHSSSTWGLNGGQAWSTPSVTCASGSSSLQTWPPPNTFSSELLSSSRSVASSSTGNGNGNRQGGDSYLERAQTTTRELLVGTAEVSFDRTTHGRHLVLNPPEVGRRAACNGGVGVVRGMCSRT
jgi:hypothetical protein